MGFTKTVITIREKRQYFPREDATKQEVWLCDIINKSGFSYASFLAKEIYITRQQMYNLMNGKSRISFPMVCAICYVTGLDDPKEVWHEILN